MSDEQTPLMKQYWDLKNQVPDALLLFRMGDFYELFGDDAIEAGRILEITVTSRDKGKANPMPMAGVPHHAVQGYLQRLLKSGKKVAIGEQMEDPAAVKGKQIVRREITRVFTPGVQFDQEGAEANFLALVLSDSGKWLLACLDASTGETLVGEPGSLEDLAQDLGALPVRHLIATGELPEEVPLALRSGTLIEKLPQNYLSLELAGASLKNHYDVADLSALVSGNAAAQALGILVTYVLRTQKQEKLAHLRIPRALRAAQTLTLGPNSAQHLDLLPADLGTPNLYSVINRTRSALGARMLRRWILAPLKNVPAIRSRQETVRELAGAGALAKLSARLAEVYDLERISGRINARLANPRDTLALGRTLGALEEIAAALEKSSAPRVLELGRNAREAAALLQPLATRILSTQREEAPLSARDGGIFKLGANPELDHLINLNENGQRWLVDLETREREATGISSLKVRYNRVFGYYIEITQAHLKNVPPHYQRKQTMMGAERFFTDELKKFEEEILTASFRQKALEQQMFEELLSAAQAQTAKIMEAGAYLGELDALASLAQLADEAGWVFPEIDESQELAIRAGRHPLVDLASRGSFVPNDLELSPATRMTLMITGPNMGGKSTVMRQTALIVILGQMGAPVPAADARWGAVSSLYTRIGAHDAIARGQSTFMVEMTELAHIL
ncbi:MAG: DNA mismatch repair protein MutS, partial [Bdellovibrionota bacterium]